MNLEIILCPCPWCRETPELHMPIDDDTWKWSIFCANIKCRMKPESPYVSIRKTSKTIRSRFLNKVKELAQKWNQGNPIPAKDKKVVDLEKIEKNFNA